jgi:hypothetical protein
MANLQWKNGASWVDVPTLAAPGSEAGEGHALLVRPAPTDRDGNNLPAGIFGLPHVEVSSKQMYAGADNTTGMRWWMARFANADQEAVGPLCLTALDPRSGTWGKYSGMLLRPMWGNFRPGVTAQYDVYEDVVIVLQDVTVTT